MSYLLKRSTHSNRLVMLLRHLIPWIRKLRNKKKHRKPYDLRCFFESILNRSDPIRTGDLCVPNAALYQAEPRFVLYVNERILFGSLSSLPPYFETEATTFSSNNDDTIFNGQLSTPLRMILGHFLTAFSSFFSCSFLHIAGGCLSLHWQVACAMMTGAYLNGG